MFMRHISGLATDSVREWKNTREQRKSGDKRCVSRVFLLAAYVYGFS